MPEFVVVSAARFEAEAFLKSPTAARLAVDYLSCGIGPLHAARAEAALAEAVEGRHVIFIGSCGSFYPFAAVHLVTAREAQWLPTCERVGISSSIAGLHPPRALPPPPDWLDLPAKTVLCCPAISHQGDLPQGDASLPARSELLENLELYSCMAGLSAHAQSLAVILAVTNEVGPVGRAQWREHHRVAAELTASYLEQQLSHLPL